MNICIHHISTILQSIREVIQQLLTLATRVIPLVFMTEQLQMKHDVTLFLIGLCKVFLEKRDGILGSYNTYHVGGNIYLKSQNILTINEQISAFLKFFFQSKRAQLTLNHW